MVRVLNIVMNLAALLAGGVLLIFFSPVIMAYVIYVYFFVRPVLDADWQKT